MVLLVVLGVRNQAYACTAMGVLVGNTGNHVPSSCTRRVNRNQAYACSATSVLVVNTWNKGPSSCTRS